MTSYRVDQIGGTDRHNHDRDGGSVRDVQRIAKASWDAKRAAVERAVKAIMRFIAKQHEGRYINEITEKSIREVLGEPDGQPITEADLDAISMKVAERFVSYLSHRGTLESVARAIQEKGNLQEEEAPHA